MEPTQVLKQAKTVLLIDWPNPGVPRALVEAGLTVYGFSPHRYSTVELVGERPHDVADRCIWAPAKAGENGYLVFRALPNRPDRVDLVCSYRPEEELPEIVAKHVLPLGARALWIQPPPAVCERARRLATEHGLVC